MTMQEGVKPPSGPGGPGGGPASGDEVSASAGSCRTGGGGGRALRVRELGRISYQEGLDLQAGLIPAVRAGEAPETLLLLEHEHVITLGTSSSPEHVLADEARRRELGIELFETGRGGDVTYHGPGQLVGYPILDLKPDRKDLHRYLRDLEEALIRALAHFGVTGFREEGLTGVWTGAGKIAAIGVRVSSGWITSHGFALNVDPDLDYFGTIVPCGIQDRAVASLAGVLGREVAMAEVREVVAESVAGTFGRRLLRE
jgi:lipoate-protein ligase B